MAHEIRLTRNGFSPIYLAGPSATFCQVEEFHPTTPKLRTRGFSPPYMSDGGESIPAYENVQERLSGAIRSTSAVSVASRVNDIESYFRLAMQRQRLGVGQRIYLEIKVDEIDSDWWRSEILGGSIEFDSDLMVALGQDMAFFTMSIERRFYWEGPQVALDLTSEFTTTPATSARIYNDSDAHASGSTWVNIASTELTGGSIPSPCNLRIRQDEVTSQYRIRMYISNNVANDPAGFDPYLLDTELDGGGGAWNASQTAWQDMLYWNLSTGQIADCGGHFMRVLMAGVTSGVPSSSSTYGTWVRCLVQGGVADTGFYSTLWTGDAVNLNSGVGGIHDFGAVPIPPAASGVSYRYIRLTFQAINSNPSGGGTYTPEFVHLMPVTGFRRLDKVATTYSTPQNGETRDYGIEELLYEYDPVDTANEPVWIGRGDPIQLWPGVQNRLYILYAGDAFTVSEQGNQQTVSIDWRPRRLTI